MYKILLSLLMVVFSSQSFAAAPSPHHRWTKEDAERKEYSIAADLAHYGRGLSEDAERKEHSIAMDIQLEWPAEVSVEVAQFLVHKAPHDWAVALEAVEYHASGASKKMHTHKIPLHTLLSPGHPLPFMISKTLKVPVHADAIFPFLEDKHGRLEEFYSENHKIKFVPKILKYPGVLESAMDEGYDFESEAYLPYPEAFMIEGRKKIHVVFNPRAEREEGVLIVEIGFLIGKGIRASDIIKDR